MKKTILITLTLIFFFTGMLIAEEKKAKKRDNGDIITKSYMLKYVTPESVRRGLKAYMWQASHDDNSNMISVTLPKSKLTVFEKMLKQFDVERKKVMLRIFTVIASSDGKSTPIENPDLRKVLTELKKVLSFKSFHLDGVSALNVMDGQKSSELRLSSKSNLNLNLERIRVQKGNKEEVVRFGFLLRQLLTDADSRWETLVRSDTSVKIGGYLVAGVSKIGKNGDSVVLVINAQIQ